MTKKWQKVPYIFSEIFQCKFPLFYLKKKNWIFFPHTCEDLGFYILSFAFFQKNIVILYRRPLLFQCSKQLLLIRSPKISLSTAEVCFKFGNCSILYEITQQIFDEKEAFYMWYFMIIIEVDEYYDKLSMYILQVPVIAYCKTWIKNWVV